MWIHNVFTFVSVLESDYYSDLFDSIFRGKVLIPIYKFTFGKHAIIYQNFTNKKPSSGKLEKFY